MYDRNELVTKVLRVIEEEKLVFFDDIAAFVEPSRATLYNMELHDLDTIKDALDKNKLARKLKMRRNWESLDSAPLQIAAYKLMATDDELEKLNTSYNKNENSGEIAVTWNEVKTYEAK